jgi:hypothetical protein
MVFKIATSKFEKSPKKRMATPHKEAKYEKKEHMESNNS